MKDYHAACLKNNYYVPALNSPLCTKEFLLQVRSGEVWVPMLNDVKLGACPFPPSISVIQIALVEFLDQNVDACSDESAKPRIRVLANHLRARPGDKPFMLAILASISERKHRFFEKDYLPPKKQSMQIEEMKVDNSDNFFTGLPESSKHGNSRRGNVNLLLSK